MIDEYQRSAEFIDIMLAEPWRAFGPVLADALTGIDTSGSPIVDVGAGGGHGTAIIANTVQGAAVLAVEPSLALRSVLLARVNADPRPAQVTVLAEDLLNAQLPARLGAVVAMNVLGHFDSDQRKRIWTLLDERLAPGGVMVPNLQPPTTPAAVPETHGSTVCIGRRRYEGWARAEPAGTTQLTWHMTYRTYHDDTLVDEVKVSYAWWAFTEGQLRDNSPSIGSTSHRPDHPTSRCT